MASLPTEKEKNPSVHPLHPRARRRNNPNPLRHRPYDLKVYYNYPGFSRMSQSSNLQTCFSGDSRFWLASFHSQARRSIQVLNSSDEKSPKSKACEIEQRRDIYTGNQQVNESYNGPQFGLYVKKPWKENTEEERQMRKESHARGTDTFTRSQGVLKKMQPGTINLPDTR